MDNNKPLETKEKIEDGMTVQVPKKLFDEMEKRLKRLEATANKGRVSNYDRAHEDDKTTIIKLRVIDGKVIVGWSDLLTNKVEINPVTKKVEEDQKLEVYYEDKTTEKMDIVTFNRRYNYIETKLTEERSLKKPEDIAKYGNRILIVEDAEGKEYQVGEKFVN